MLRITMCAAAKTCTTILSKGLPVHRLCVIKKIDVSDDG